MKKIITCLLLIIFFINLNLPAFAVTETKTAQKEDIYLLNFDYKNSFLTNNFSENENKVFSISLEVEKSISPNLWLWSFLYPGLGQLIMGDYGWGIFFATVPPIILALGLMFLFDFKKAISSGAVSFISGEILIGAPALIIYLILYISNLINASFLNLKLSPQLKKENKGLKTENQPSLSWMLSIIIPGGGQLISGEIFRGLAFLVLETMVFGVSIFLSNLLPGNMDNYIFFATFAGFHIWNIIDAYKVTPLKTEEIKRVEPQDHLFIKNTPNGIVIKNQSLVYQIQF